MGLYFGGKLVSPVVTKEVAKTKFGASVDTWIGDVDGNGVLNKTTWKGALNFAGVKEIALNGLRHAFYYKDNIISADFSSVTTIKQNGLEYAFAYSDIKSADFSSLKTVETGGFRYSFYYSTIESIDFSSLETLGSNSMQYTFYNAKLTKISFPSLTSVQTDSFGSSTSNGAFRGCTALTEIHFRADMQATIEAMSQYANKWGATNATIYFDL